MARAFVSGSSQRIAIPLNLSIYSSITISVWVYADAMSGAGKMAFSFRGPASTGSGFFFQPWNGTRPEISFFWATNQFWSDTFPAPSAAVWHHYLFAQDRVAKTNRAWVDGVSQTITTISHSGSAAGNFGTGTLELGAYVSSTYFTGRIADFAIWGGVLLGQGEAAELSRNSSPLQVRPDRLTFYPPVEGVNPEPIYGRMGDPLPNIATVTGATAVAHPLGERAIVRPKRKILVRV